MTTRIPVRYGGTGANTASQARTNLGAAPLAAYDQANNAYAQANLAYAQANNARSDSNTTFATINSTFGTINTNITTANTQANNAYAQANLAYAAANNSNLKSGGLISGTLNVTQDIIVGGNLYLSGNTTYINVSTYQVNDPLIYLAANNSLTDSVDIGFIGGKNTGGTYSHTGLARDATDTKWKLFDNLPDEAHINNIINFANATYATLVANLEAQSILLNGNLVATNVNVNAAYSQANTAYAQGNAAYSQANSAYGQANLAYTQANNSYSQANLAYTQANTANTQANLAYIQANNSYSQANLAYTQANNSYSQANLAYTQANSAYSQANLAYTAANTSGNTVRVSANGGSTLSNKQLNFVNTANVTVAVTDSGDGNANVAFFVNAGGGGSLSNISVSQNSSSTVNANSLNFVNSATVTISVTPGVNGNANISFTSVGGSSNATNISNTVITRDQFTGNGAQTLFNLTLVPESLAHTLVFVDRVFQLKNAYTLNGNQLEFAGAPDSGASIEAYTYGAAGGSAIITPDIFTANGVQTSFTLTQPSKTGRTLVFIDGVSQRPNVDFQVNSTTLSMNVAPANGSVVEVRGFALFNTVDINVAPVTLMSDKLTGTGSCTVFGLSQTGTTDSTFVFINGVSQKPTTDYSVSSNTIVFTTAPANGSTIEVRSVGNFKVIEPESKIESDTFTGTGACTTYTISTYTATKKAFVHIDGVAQIPFTDYSVSGNQLVFTEAPPANSNIEVRTFTPFAVAEQSKTLIVYSRTGTINIPIRLGVYGLTVVGRSANTSVGVS
jgi:hypothetical protein